MARRSLLLVLLAPLLTPACVTKSLWRDWEPRPARLARPLPVAVEGGVRTGDGTFHVLARCHDDEVRRIVVRPFVPASPDWPDANRRGEDPVSLHDDDELPPGLPLRTEVEPAELAGEVVDDRPRIELEAGALRVHHRGGTWLLATFSAPPAVEPGPRTERWVIVALTPLTLVADVATLPFQLLGLRLDDEPELRAEASGP